MSLVSYSFSSMNHNLMILKQLRHHLWSLLPVLLILSDLLMMNRELMTAVVVMVRLFSYLNLRLMATGLLLRKDCDGRGFMKKMIKQKNDKLRFCGIWELCEIIIKTYTLNKISPLIMCILIVTKSIELSCRLLVS